MPNEQKQFLEEYYLPPKKDVTKRKKSRKEKEEREKKPPPPIIRKARRADRDIKNLLSKGDDPREAMQLAEEWDIGYYQDI